MNIIDFAKTTSKICINISPGVSIMSLPNELIAIRNWGFDGIELNLGAFPLIIAGKVCREYTDYLKIIFNEHCKDMVCSAHIGRGLDLRADSNNLPLQLNILYASIEICTLLELSPLVLHFEQSSGNKDIEDRFLQCLADAEKYATKQGVQLVLENIEIEHYKPVLAAVKEIGTIPLNLDVGHLYLASRYFGFSFEDAIDECIPYVAHCHLSDNSGMFEPMRIDNFDLYNVLPMDYRIAQGRGDIHMPPLYGNVPIPLAITKLKKFGFFGPYVCEYPFKLFEPFNAEICNNLRILIN